MIDLSEWALPNYFSCIGKGGRYFLLNNEQPIGAGKSKVFDPIVVYVDAKTYKTYWRFEKDFLERMEIITDENTEEIIRNKNR